MDFDIRRNGDGCAFNHKTLCLCTVGAASPLLTIGAALMRETIEDLQLIAFVLAQVDPRQGMQLQCLQQGGSRCRLRSDKSENFLVVSNAVLLISLAKLAK